MVGILVTTLKIAHRRAFSMACSQGAPRLLQGAQAAEALFGAEGALRIVYPGLGNGGRVNMPMPSPGSPKPLPALTGLPLSPTRNRRLLTLCNPTTVMLVAEEFPRTTRVTSKKGLVPHSFLSQPTKRALPRSWTHR